MRLLIFIALHCATVLAGAEPAVSANDLPRLPAPSLTESQAALHARPGLRVEVAASEPNVVAPVAMAFDEFGALYVVEMRDYPLPERRDKKMGTVRKLIDADGDGVFEKSTIFLKDLPWPTGIACARFGVYVLASPDLIFAIDTNRDGVADERETIATGFASGKAKPNVQALPNSLTWGSDGRIWGATAGNGGVVSEQSLNGQDFSIDPVTNKVRREVGTAQFGLTFDEMGRRFVCSNSHHLQWVPWERHHGADAVTLLDISVDGPAAEVFRTSPEEAWRVVRTRWRATGQVPGLVEGGGRSSGYFTSACGLHVYRGDALGAEFLGNVFICDVGSNLVHRKIIRQQGDSLVAERPADEVKSEFLTSDSNWFRPVACTIGPDGALYIADMAREIIEHPDSLPDNIKSHLDLASGENLGRIWRVVPKDWKRPHRPLPSFRHPAELVRMLEHPNAWHRETAQRLLALTTDVEGEVTRPTPGQADAAVRDAGLLTSPSTAQVEGEVTRPTHGQADAAVRDAGLLTSPSTPQVEGEVTRPTPGQADGAVRDAGLLTSPSTAQVEGEVTRPTPGQADAAVRDAGLLTSPSTAHVEGEVTRPTHGQVDAAMRDAGLLTSPSTAQVEGEVTRPTHGQVDAAVRDAGLLTSPSTAQVEGEVTRPTHGQADAAVRDAGLLTSPSTGHSRSLHRSASPLILPILAKRDGWANGELKVADVKRVWDKAPGTAKAGIVRWLGECQGVKDRQMLRALLGDPLAEAQHLALEMAESTDPFVLAELPAILRPIWGAETRDQLLRLYRKDSARVKQAVRLAATASEILTIAQEVHDPELWALLGKSGRAANIAAARNFLESSDPISLAELAALGAAPSAKTVAAIKAEFAKGTFTKPAVTLLIKAEPAEGDFLKQCVLDAQIPQALRAQVVPALDGSAVEQLITKWSNQPIPIRQAVLDWYLKSSVRAKPLLEHISLGKPAIEELSADQINHARRLLPEQAKVIFGAPVDRQKVINERLGALTLNGNATKGEVTFRQRCLVCHRHGNEGNPVGPERKTFRNLGKPSLLVNLLDPNREVAGAYQLITIKTKSGETHAGLLMSEGAHEIHFRNAQGLEMTLLRAEVEKLELSNRSLMPEGLEQGMTDQDLADLLEFLAQP
jgi:putative membrane-bound dehydrogenase-like protein